MSSTSLTRAVLKVTLGISVIYLQSYPVWAAIDKKPVVFVKKVELQELSETLTYPARIEPRIRASIVAEADGIVSRITAPLGTLVKPGASLAVIRNTDPVYQYSPLKVTSPVAGIVSRVEITEGSRVSRGDKLLLVTDPEQVRVVIEVAAADVRSIRSGQLAQMKLSGQDEPLRLRVKGISPFVDPATGTASCELEAEGSQQLPLPGTINRVTFKVNERKGFSIPDTAITYRGKDPYVRTVNAGKAKLTAVKLGRKEAGVVEILKGLKAGDEIIERASGFVADGEAVEVQSAAKDSTQG